MKKITFLISVLSSGGAARVLSVLANHFSRSPDFDVSVVSHVRASGYSFDGGVGTSALFEPAEMRRDFINKVWRRVAYWPRLLSVLSRNRPDAVIVFLRGMNWRGILACRMLGIPVIATEHTNHRAERGFWSWIERQLVYRLADRLVVLSKFDWEYYSRYLPRVSLIPNPLSFIPITKRVTRAPVVLAVGDLNRWHIKGFDTLIVVFGKLAADFPQWVLRFVGPGDLGLQTLQQRVLLAGLAGRVEFAGFSTEVDKHMRSSEIFVLPSRYEGFSMVLLEAMSQGCACISFDCRSGPSDLLDSDISGVLVPDQDAIGMEAALRSLMDSEPTRRRLADAAVCASHAYTASNIEARWHDCLDGLGERPKPFPEHPSE